MGSALLGRGSGFITERAGQVGHGLRLRLDSRRPPRRRRRVHGDSTERLPHRRIERPDAIFFSSSLCSFFCLFRRERENDVTSPQSGRTRPDRSPRRRDADGVVPAQREAGRVTNCRTFWGEIGDENRAHLILGVQHADDDGGASGEQCTTGIVPPVAVYWNASATITSETPRRLLRREEPP